MNNTPPNFPAWLRRNGSSAIWYTANRSQIKPAILAEAEKLKSEPGPGLDFTAPVFLPRHLLKKTDGTVYCGTCHQAPALAHGYCDPCWQMWLRKKAQAHE